MVNVIRTALSMKCQEMSGKTNRISTCALQHLMSVFSENCVSFGLLLSEYFQYGVNNNCHKKVSQNQFCRIFQNQYSWERIFFFSKILI